MFAPAENKTHHATLNRKTDSAQGSKFFGDSHSASFFGRNSFIQPKLEVSHPNDPQEKEADSMADHVMRMADPVSVSAMPEKKEELHRAEEKKEEKKVHAKSDSSNEICCKEEEHKVDRAEEKKEEKVHPKFESHILHRAEEKKEEKKPVQTKLYHGFVHRMSDEKKEEAGASASATAHRSVQRKNITIHRSDAIQRSGRGPPRVNNSFEQSLSSSRGSGNVLPNSTMSFMENRFGADFSRVRIHTGGTAQNLTSSIQAQAFTHGNDIYFNSGKYSPHSSGGGMLLAHELTHTIQQGASPLTSTSSHASSSSVSPKINCSRTIQRKPSGAVPQLTQAVEHAKSHEGKVNANKTGPDGNRQGWEQLIEYFKTALGEEKIIPEGGPLVPGAISEAQIKKQTMVPSAAEAEPRASSEATSNRDAMPSWCGIFVFWALHKGGVPMRQWILGGKNVPPDAAYPQGHIPKAGDIAYRNAHSHFALVEKMNGKTVTTINGNTSGANNLGAQIQTRDHPLAEWTAFFNPLLLMDGSLQNADEKAKDSKPKSLSELRSTLFQVNRSPDKEMDKEEGEHSETELLSAKPELSSSFVDAKGKLNLKTAEPSSPKKEDEKLQRKDKEEEQEPQSAVTHSPVQKKSEGVSLFRKSDAVSHSSKQSSILHSAISTHTKNANATSAPALSLQPTASAQSRGPPVQTKAGNIIQCGWFDSAMSAVNSAMDFVAEGLEAGKQLILGQVKNFVMGIPGYQALAVVLGEDPITGEVVERNGRNFLRAAFDIMPFGDMLFQKLEELGATQDAAAWIDQQIVSVIALAQGAVTSFSQFWNGITLDALANPLDLFEKVGSIIQSFISSVVDFAVRAGTELLGIVKRFLLNQLATFVRDHTTAYPLLRVILGKDPITEEAVERNGTNILNAILELSEEGREQRTQMQDTGTFQKVADWIDRGIAIFSGAYEEIIQGFHHIWDVVSISSLMNPVETFMVIYNTFAPPIGRVLSFMGEVAVIILKFIKDALMVRLSEWAKTVRGYTLVTVIIQRDPFTNDPVPFTMENIIHGFMSLMEGGEEQFTQMKQTGAIERSEQRLTAAMNKLNMTPEYIVGLFMALWNAFSIRDLLKPTEAFERILAEFGEPILKLIEFVIEVVKIVVQVILEIMNFPFDLINNIITRAMAAFESIKRDPIGFLKNLMRAIKQGFIQFFDNILTHLINGVVGWLTSELKDANVPAPQDFSLKGIISWVLAVLGISMEAIWQKLAAHPKIGPERVAKLRSLINTLEGIWTFIKDVQERGITAIWEHIQEQLSNLWNIVLDAVKNWIMEKIVTAVVTKLLSFLDPTGIMAVINSAIAIYKAVQSFIKYLRQMLEVVNSFVNGVADIAEGNITTAANYLESTMGRTMPIVIGFLANQVGLGGVGKKVGEMIGKVREMIDKALIWLVNKAVDTGFAIFDRIMAVGRSAAAGVRSALGLEETYTNEAGEGHSLAVERNQSSLVVKRASGTPLPITEFLTVKANEVNNPISVFPNEQKDEMRTAINEAQTIINSIQAISYPADAPEESTTHLQQQVNSLLAQLKRQVQIIDRSASPVPPVAVVPGFSSNLASTFNVKYLLKGHHPPGTPASNYSGEMHGATTVLQAIGLLPNKWVNFHILNHNYGGLAVDSNLVPTPKNVNKNYLDSFESPFKDKYDDPAGPKVMWFNSNVVYRSDSVFAQSISSEGGAMKSDGRNWIPNPAQQLPPWSSEVPEPVADTLVINKLPSSVESVRQLARYTPLVQDLLVILKKIKPPVVTGKSTLLSVLANYANNIGMDASQHNSYIGQINATTFDFSQD